MTLYRKYRFQTLDEMVGQSAVKETLKAAIEANKLAHAYLLCGPRGTGKTSTARVLAKIVNCEQETKSINHEPKTHNLPCNECASCISITEGTNLDVVEMDAASNRGIDDIRSLRENIRLAPTHEKKKIYIIDEVHMLSGDAFNALLKTLEEPPPHVMFILATTEAHKVPVTILSRVQRLDFKLATLDELADALRRVAKAEKITIDDDALLLLGKSAQGSFRDGIKLLDQLSGFPKITAEIVGKALGRGVQEGIYLLLRSIAQKDTPEALNKLIIQLENGVNPKETNLAVLDMLRQMLLIKNSLGEQLVKPEVGAENYQSYQKLADGFELTRLLKVIDCFQKSLEQSRFVSISSLPLEVAVAESCGIGQSDQKSTLHVPSSTVNTSPQSDDLQRLQDKWPYVLETIRQYNYSLEALLRSSRIISCEKSNVVIEVPYTFHQRILEAPKSRDPLESIFADVLGRPVKVTTDLKKRETKDEDLANVEVAGDDEIINAAAEIFNSEPVG